MRNQVMRDFFETRLGTNEFGKLRPPALCRLASNDTFLIFNDILHILVEFINLRPVDVQFSKAALVKDGYSGMVILSILNVVNADIAAENGTCIFIFKRNRCAGEAYEGSARQRIAHIFSKAVNKLRANHFFRLAILDINQTGLKAILTAVCLIRNNDHVAARAKRRMVFLIFEQGKLLNRGKDNAARLACSEHFAKLVSGFCLFGGLLKQFLGAAKLLIELVVQVVAVGHHHKRGVVHLRLLQKLSSITTHGDTFAGTLRMPEDTRLARAGHYFPQVSWTLFALLVTIHGTGSD